MAGTVTLEMVFDVTMELIKAAVDKYEATKAGTTTAAQAHADITATLATIGGATSGNDQMANVAEDAKFPTSEVTPVPTGTP
jgi:hypothetical protein